MKFNSQFFWRLVPVAWGVLIVYVSILPGGAGVMRWFGIPHVDKIGHMGAYGMWVFLWLLSLMKTGSYSRKMQWLIVCMCIVIGCGLEFGQYFLHQGRSFEVWDMAANIAGVAIGAWTSLIILKSFSKRGKEN